MRLFSDENCFLMFPVKKKSSFRFHYQEFSRNQKDFGSSNLSFDCFQQEDQDRYVKQALVAILKNSESKLTSWYPISSGKAIITVFSIVRTVFNARFL